MTTNHDLVPGLRRPALLDDRRAVRPGDPGHQHRRAGRRLAQPVRPDLLRRAGGYAHRPVDRVPVQPAADGDGRARHGRTPAPVCPGLGLLGLGLWVAANLVGNRGIGLVG